MSKLRMLIIKTGSGLSEARRRFGDFDVWFRQSRAAATGRLAGGRA